MAKLGSPALAAQWGQAVSGAAVEELVKVAGVVSIALVAPGHINGMVDGFVYGALVGLGFQDGGERRLRPERGWRPTSAATP